MGYLYTILSQRLNSERCREADRCHEAVRCLAVDPYGMFTNCHTLQQAKIYSVAMDYEKPQPAQPETERLRQSFEQRRRSERPVPYSIAKAYRLLIAEREDTKRSG